MQGTWCMSDWRRAILFPVILAASALFGGGCGGIGGLYNHSDDRPAALALTAPSTWRLQGDVYHPERAADGDRDTTAVSGLSYRNATITIDLGKACLFNAIFIDHGPSEVGFCRTVAVLTSLDGKHFTRRHEGPGTRRVTSLCIIRPTLARYICLQAVRPGTEPWSLAEIYIQ